MRMETVMSRALRVVTKGRAAAPPACGWIMGVSTSRKPRSSRKRRMRALIWERVMKVFMASGLA